MDERSVSRVFQNSNLRPTINSFTVAEIVKRAHRLGGCTRYLSPHHRAFDCISKIRCAACFKYGHKYKVCLTRSQPSIFWRPKEPCQSEWVRLDEEARPEVEAVEANSNSPPNQRTVLFEEENPSPTISPPQSPAISPSPVGSLSDSNAEDMAHFAVNPTPYVPNGFEVEDWARPARGRIIVCGNPPRRHEEYAIVTVHPPPPQNELYDVAEEVIDYLKEAQRARVESCCLSPLGLCLVQFSSPIVRQAMINLNPHQLDVDRQFIVFEHDRGINLRSCPFTRTCLVMFLAFPLDFQMREIISQAVGHFGAILTWTSNTRCKTRVLLRCKVTLVSRVPRSILICEGSSARDNGSSWTVPVFILGSQLNDVLAGDEDQILPNGNPHPQNDHFVHSADQGPGFFEDVGDLDQVE